MMTSIAFAMAMAAAQTQTTFIPVGTQGRQPQKAPTAEALKGDESPEDIAKDSARDLKDSRFYNKPGASRADYDADWQKCRLIARGSRTPSGTMTYVYNPAVVSPIAAGVGGGIGAVIAQAIIEGQIRRANRRSCLLIHGWSWIEVDDAERTRVAALPDSEKQAYFNAILGAKELGKEKKVIQWHNDFAAPRLAPETEQ